ncbi:MAG: amino-acid N-acetyltransferase [Thiotrichaceae bacterium]
MSNKKCTRIDFFYEAAPYIHNHRDKTFVVALSGEVVAHPRFTQILKDIAILNSLGVRVILVHGARPQVNEALKQIGHDIDVENDLRVTDDTTLVAAKNIIGAIRIDIENKLTSILNTPPSINNGTGILSGNFITAKPLGILNGVDYKHTGEVRKINVELINSLLEKRNLVLLSPLGFSPTGETYNLRYEQIASFTAKAVTADKLIFIHTEDLGLAKQTERLGLQTLIAQHPSKRLYQDINDALEQGVQRIHLINADIEGGLLLELYTRDGVGALFSANHYEDIHPATIEHVTGILDLIKPLEEKGTLIKRSREQLELEIENFSIIERDEKIIGCAACYIIPDTQVGELACLAIHKDYYGQQRGDTLLNYTIEKAKQLGLTQLLVLTTQTTDWFQERGFEVGTIDDLPDAKKELYNFQRKSKILLKNI